MFWCVSNRFGAFATIWLPCETWGETFRTSAKVCATKSRRNFTQRMHQIHPVGLKLSFWCVSYYLGALGTVWLPYKTRCKMGRTSAKVRAMKSRRNVFATNTPDPPHWTLNRHFNAFHNIWMHLGPFGCPTKLGAKRAELVQKFVP